MKCPLETAQHETLLLPSFGKEFRAFQDVVAVVSEEFKA